LRLDMIRVIHVLCAMGDELSLLQIQAAAG
jgi:hypothetical protein